MRLHQALLAAVCVSMGLLALSAPVSSGAGEGLSEKEGGPADMAGLSERQADQMRQDRKRIIQRLLSVAQEKTPERELSPTSPQVLAIGLLGEYRAEEAVDLLVRNIELFVPRSSFELIPASSYPCVRSLARIGLPALAGILRQLEGDVTTKQTRLFATVVMLIDGEKMGLVRLEDALKNATGKKLSNLQTLVKMYKAGEWQY